MRVMMMPHMQKFVLEPGIASVIKIIKMQTGNAKNQTENNINKFKINYI
jgi:hypothetical protein